MARIVYEIEFDEDFHGRIIRAIMYGAPLSFTDTDLLKRWIAKGLAYEMGGMKSEEECASVVNRAVRITRK